MCRQDALSPRAQAVVCTGFILFVLIAVLTRQQPLDEEARLAAGGGGSGDSRAGTGGTSAASTTTPFRILCYGDSLTSGIVAPSSSSSDATTTAQRCPYAPHLKAALEESSSSRRLQYEVHHRALINGTTTHILQKSDEEYGLRRYLYDQESVPPADLVIILAGSYDVPLLMSEANPGKDEDAVVHGIERGLTANLLAMHEMALASGAAHTMAVGIPLSVYQLENKAAASVVAQVNRQLQHHGQGSRHMTYAPWPIDFRPHGTSWSPDGFHPSCKGYSELGRKLAESVLAHVEDANIL